MKETKETKRKFCCFRGIVYTDDKSTLPTVPPREHINTFQSAGKEQLGKCDLEEASKQERKEYEKYLYTRPIVFMHCALNKSFLTLR